MASGTMVSRVLGFVKVALLVVAIGQTQSMSADAFANGNLLPNTLYVILLGGMLNAVLVPQIVKAAKNADGGAGYINKVLTLVATFMTAITIIVMLAAPWIVWAVTLAWGPDQRALALAFAYWCLPQIMFYGLYTVLGEVLNARSVFGPFTWAPVLNNVIGIVGIVVFIAMFGTDPNGDRLVTDWTPTGIAILAGSSTLGVASQALILFVSWRRAGLKYRPDFKWRGMGLGRTARIAGWSLAMIGVLQIGGLVTTNVLNAPSGSGPSVTAMNNAWLVFMLPHSVIAVSLSTAYFTRLSDFAHRGKMTDFRENFSASTRQITFLMMLAGVLMFVTAPFISRVLQFESNFEQVDQFTLVLQAYTLGVAGHSFLFMVQRSFYALSDTRTPFFFALAQMVLLISLTIPLLFAPKEMIGMLYAIIWSSTMLLETLLATWLLRRRIGSIDGRRVLSSIVRFAVAAIPAFIAGWILTRLMIGWVPEYSAIQAIMFALIVSVVAGSIYFGALLGLRSPEAEAIWAQVRGRLTRRVG